MVIFTMNFLMTSKVLVNFVRGLLFHQMDASIFNYKIPAERAADVDLRYTYKILEKNYKFR